MPDSQQEIRRILLEAINELQPDLQSMTILRIAQTRLNITINLEMEQALLTAYHDLFRNGILAWGYNLSNTDPPFCHLTEQGRRTLEHLSRDPANPDGYLAHLERTTVLHPISKSYIKEALQTYNNNCYKAAAVMMGAASEALILMLRDSLVNKITQLGRTPLNNLKDWRIKKVIDSIRHEINNQKQNMLASLFESFDSYWIAFTQQIRAVRNDVGHPSSIDPVTEESVHGSLLIFPDLAKLASDLNSWINTSYT